MATAYEWVNHRYAIDPNYVGQTIEKIEERDGFCHPAALVNEARPEDSPLHPLCEWDDHTAAERHREDQMRRVISSLTVVGAPVKDSPAFISVRISTEKGSYISTVRAKENRQYLDFALMEAKRQLSYVRRRYGMLKELQEVWKAIDEVDDQAA